MVQGFDSQTNRRELEDLFGEFGKVAEINIPLDYRTRRPRGLAFIRYYKQDDQEACIDSHKRNPLKLGRDELRCEFAHSKPKPGDSRWRRSPPRGGGRGYDDRRGGGYDRRDDYRRDNYRRD